MKCQLIVGADPGKTGALAALRCENFVTKQVRIFPTPILPYDVEKKDGKVSKRFDYDLLAIIAIFTEITADVDPLTERHAFVERPRENGTRKLSSYSALLLGQSYTSWAMGALMFGFTLHNLDPKEWKGEKLAGYADREDKENSLIEARKVFAKFPQVLSFFELKGDDGKAEAGLMADLGRTRLLRLWRQRCSL